MSECNCKKDKCLSPAVLQINNQECPVVFHKVTLPAAMGDDETNPPRNGQYRNVLLVYEANEHVYMFSSDGIPTLISDGGQGVDDYNELTNKPSIEGYELVGDSSLEDIGVTDAIEDVLEDYTPTSEFAEVAFTGDYDDLIGTPAIPTQTSDLTNDGSDGTSTYVEADELATVATSGSYNDLSNKPTIPTVNNATLTIQKNGTTVNTFTANASSNVTANITVPTKTSDLTNNGADNTSTYVEADELAAVATSGSYNDLSGTPAIPSYSDFTGATSSVAGASGLVPAPAAGDDTKFLSGDGTWKTVSGGSSYTAGNGISIDVNNEISIDDTVVAELSDLPTDFTGATASVAGAHGLVPAPAAGDQGKVLHGDGTWKDATAKLVEMSYGESNAWAKFIAAYNAGSIVYCRASSNANPATGSQTRKAFMAYANNATNPTSVEFQYVRSVSSKTASQPVDQVFVYTLTSANGGTWTATTRNMGPKLAQGTNTTVSYSNGTYTISATQPTVNDATLTIQQNGTSLGTFTANASSSATIDVNAPKLTSLVGSVQTSDYHRSVVALCEVASGSGSTVNSWSSGKLVAHRNNGAYGVAEVDINIEAKRATAYYSNVSYFSNIALLSPTANINTDLGFRPCTFKYNNVYYAGIEFYISSSSASNVYFSGVGNFDVFGLDYYSVAHGSTASSVLNSEVYNSLNYTQWNEERNRWRVGRATRDIIYDNGSGTNANFSTTTAMSSYDDVEICYRDGNNNYALKLIPGPAGSFTLDIAHPGANSVAFWYISRYLVSGTNITVGANNMRKAIGASSITTTASQDIYITRITGIRY